MCGGPDKRYAGEQVLRAAAAATVVAAARGRRPRRPQSRKRPRAHSSQGQDPRQECPQAGTLQARPLRPASWRRPSPAQPHRRRNYWQQLVAPRCLGQTAARRVQAAEAAQTEARRAWSAFTATAAAVAAPAATAATGEGHCCRAGAVPAPAASASSASWQRAAGDAVCRACS